MWQKRYCVLGRRQYQVDKRNSPRFEKRNDARGEFPCAQGKRGKTRARSVMNARIPSGCVSRGVTRGKARRGFPAFPRPSSLYLCNEWAENRRLNGIESARICPCKNLPSPASAAAPPRLWRVTRRRCTSSVVLFPSARVYRVIARRANCKGDLRETSPRGQRVSRDRENKRIGEKFRTAGTRRQSNKLQIILACACLIE